MRLLGVPPSANRKVRGTVRVKVQREATCRPQGAVFVLGKAWLSARQDWAPQREAPGLCPRWPAVRKHTDPCCVEEPGRDLPQRKGFSSSSVYLPQVLQGVTKHADCPQDGGLASGLNSRKSQAF